jgi:hypothetical protein
VLRLHGSKPTQEVLPLDAATPDAIAFTDLGLISVSTQVSSLHTAPLASAVAFARHVCEICGLKGCIASCPCRNSTASQQLAEPDLGAESRHDWFPHGPVSWRGTAPCAWHPQ